MNKSLVFVLCTFVFSFSSYASSEITPEKKKLVDTLLEQTGQSASAVSMQLTDLFSRQMILHLKRSNPNTNPRAFDILQEEVAAVVNEEIFENGALEEMTYPIYDKYFTESDLEKMIEFNNTDAGEKMIREMPNVMRESMLAGQEFSQTLGPKIQQRLLARFEKKVFNSLISQVKEIWRSMSVPLLGGFR